MIRVSVSDQKSQSVVGESSSYPLRYLVDSSKKASATLNLMAKGELIGTLSLDI